MWVKAVLAALRGAPPHSANFTKPSPAEGSYVVYTT